MKIKQEDFDKLKQLDRIEYRQKYNLIIDEYKHDYNSIFLGYFYILLLGIGGCMILLSKLLEKDINYIFYNYFIIYGIIFIFTLISISFIINFYKSFIKIKRIKELQNSYFKVEFKK